MNGEHTEQNMSLPVSASGIASAAGRVGDTLGRTADPSLPPSVQRARDEVTTPGADATAGQPGQAGNFAQPPATPAGAPPAQPQRAPGDVWTVEQNVRRGGRPDMRAAQAEAASASALRGAAQDMGQTGQAIGALSRAQAESSFQGIRQAEALQQSNREEQQEQRAEVDRSYNRYVGALREVDEMQELDPGRLWARMDTPTRLIAGIAVGLQGVAQMFGGERVQDGPIQRMAELVQQDLGIQRDNYRRARVSARGQQSLYGIMRQRFQDERTADDLAEAAAWTMVQRRIDTYGRQIQNQGARTRLSSLAAQVSERANAATVRGLQAERLARRRARGSVSYTMGIMTPQGVQHVTMTGRQRTTQLLASARNAQTQYNQALAQAGSSAHQFEQQRHGGAVSEWRRWSRTGLPAAANLSRTHGILREMIQREVSRGNLPQDTDTSPLGFWNILAGHNPLAQYVITQIQTPSDALGRRLRQSFNTDLGNFVRIQSGQQVAEQEFRRRQNNLMEATQDINGLAQGLRVMGQEIAGGAQAIQGLSPPSYRDFLRNAGVIDPIVTLAREESRLSSALGDELPGIWNESYGWRSSDGGDIPRTNED